ncbi:MAG: VIT domain-containing protein [Asticcacaulis sp.]
MRWFLTVSMAALLAGAALPALALTPKTPPQAQVANDKPALQLVAHDIRTDRAQAIDSALTIAKLDVAVDITGRMAQTTLTVTFANPTDARLEGDFSLDLPVGASVTAYGLDVNGVMTDGVLEPKLKAQEVYEEQLRRGVDPGLAEVTAGNQFRTPRLPDPARFRAHGPHRLCHAAGARRPLRGAAAHRRHRRRRHHHGHRPRHDAGHRHARRCFKLRGERRRSGGGKRRQGVERQPGHHRACPPPSRWR